MAIHRVVKTYCDVCPEDTTDAVTTKMVALDGRAVELDLCVDHSDELVGFFLGFTQRGRRVDLKARARQR